MSDNTTAPTARESLSQLLRDGAKRNGLYSRDIAMKFGLSTEYMRRILNGSEVPTDPMLRLLCEMLGLEFDAVQPLAAEMRKLQSKRQVALKSPGFAVCLDAWVKNPKFSICGRNWLEDPQYMLFMELYDLMDPQARAALFNAAVRIQTERRKARGAAA